MAARLNKIPSISTEIHLPWFRLCYTQSKPNFWLCSTSKAWSKVESLFVFSTTNYARTDTWAVWGLSIAPITRVMSPSPSCRDRYRINMYDTSRSYIEFANGNIILFPPLIYFVGFHLFSLLFDFLLSDLYLLVVLCVINLCVQLLIMLTFE